MKKFEKIKPYLYIAPILIPIGIFIYYPIFMLFQISFLDWNMMSPDKEWVGLANYKELLLDGEFWNSVLNTVIYAILFILSLLIVPFLTAYATIHVRGKLESFYKSAIFLPTVLSLAVSAIVFLWMFNQVSGVVNTLLELIGISRINWFGSPFWTLIAIVIITTWKTFGYHFILLLSGILAVPKEIVEAARVDGVNSSFGLLWRIYLPLSGGTVFFVFVITVVFGLQWSFVPIQMLTNGGPSGASTNLIFTIYEYAFQFFNSGKAAAASILTFLFFSVLIIFQAVVMERRIHYEN